jgi:hypothetical protein
MGRHPKGETTESASHHSHDALDAESDRHHSQDALDADSEATYDRWMRWMPATPSLGNCFVASFIVYDRCMGSLLA